MSDTIVLQTPHRGSGDCDTLKTQKSEGLCDCELRNPKSKAMTVWKPGGGNFKTGYLAWGEFSIKEIDLFPVAFLFVVYKTNTVSLTGQFGVFTLA